MLLAHIIIQGQLIENSINSIAWYICLNLDKMFQIDVVENWSLEKRLLQFGKC